MTDIDSDDEVVFQARINPQANSRRKRTNYRTRNMKDQFVAKAIILISRKNQEYSFCINTLCEEMRLDKSAFYNCFLNKDDFFGYISKACENRVKDSFRRLSLFEKDTQQTLESINIINSNAANELRVLYILAERSETMEIRRTLLVDWLKLKYFESLIQSNLTKSKANLKCERLLDRFNKYQYLQISPSEINK